VREPSEWLYLALVARLSAHRPSRQARCVSHHAWWHAGSSPDPNPRFVSSRALRRYFWRNRTKKMLHAKHFGRLLGSPVGFSGEKNPFRIRRRGGEDGRAIARHRPCGLRRAKLPAGRSRTSPGCGSRIRRGHGRRSARKRRFPRPARRLRRIPRSRATRSRYRFEARWPAPVFQTQDKQQRRNSRLKRIYRANSFQA
jgi:hypothetical protein